MSELDTIQNFNDFALSKQVMDSVNEIGYEIPTPIQKQTIPHVLDGKDLVGQAQTGTGKTAAFALPLLSNIDIKQKKPQLIVLAPTRELAIQVAEAFQKYASRMNNFHVLPIYGGTGYGDQLRRLKRGVHVVVGTPGRVMDHMKRGSLQLDEIKHLVLDEADEMLKMGFIDDIEWILEQTPSNRQTLLFSATMPKQIRNIAQKYLDEPVEITIQVKTTTADTIRQRYWTVSGVHKLDALTRILEGEEFDGIIIFVRTKSDTVELSQKLQARGYEAAPLNGDIAQNQREKTVDKFKKGKLNILVATDVAARGLDVDRVSHVINYDIPYDTESYVHRIGRTGRAGRSGEAILFVAPREQRMLRAIERATNKKIELMKLPSTETINTSRIEKFKDRITDSLSVEEGDVFIKMIEQYTHDHNVPAIEVAAALARMVQGDQPLLLKEIPKTRFSEDRDSGSGRNRDRNRKKGNRESSRNHIPEEGLETYRIEVGHIHGVKPGNIVGAIANEAGLDSKYIGHIKIHEEHSNVDLPEGMPKEIFKLLKHVWVSGQQLQITREGDSPYDAHAKNRKRRGPKHPGKIKTKNKRKKG